MVSIKKSWPFLLGLILSASLLWPLFKAPFFTHHDDVQIIRLHQIDKCFHDGQIPCRWVPDLGNLYGYPLFNYYAPLPYYFGQLIYFFSHSLIISVKVMFATAFLGSYIFMYFLARKFWGNLGGSMSAIFYSFAPYHALDFYVRGAMGEMWALMFFPAIFWASAKLEEETNIKNFLLLSIFSAFLITSHNISTMIFTPILLVWLTMLYLKRKNMYFIRYSLGAIVVGVLLSSFYFLPMLFEKNLVHVETTTYGYFSYTEHYKGLRKLILDRSWGWGASVREVPGGEKDGMSFQIGWVHLLGLILALICAVVFWKKNKWVSLVIFSSIGLTILCIFMVNLRSDFLWKAFDSPLRYIQFPWRFLILIIFLISFISGSFFILNIKRKNIFFLLLVSLVVLLNFSYFRPEKFLDVTEKQLLSGENWDKQIKRAIFDYLPISAKEPPAELVTKRYKILTGDAEVLDFEQGSNWFKFNTKVKTHTIIRMSQYYFPDWKIIVDGKQSQVEYTNNNLGLMTIILGEGDHRVEGRLFDTPIRSIGNIISLISFLIVLIISIVQFKRVRKWVTYYRKRIN